MSFANLGPTVLSLAGVKPPASMQGKAFLGRIRRLHVSGSMGLVIAWMPTATCSAQFAMIGTN